MNLLALARPEIAAMQPYASARAMADSSGILLNANENPWAPASGTGLALNRYPEPQPAELKIRMAEYYGIDPARLLVTRGSDEGIDLLVRAFCRAGTDRVMICPPCFGMYAISARIQGAGIVPVPLVESGSGFELDRDTIRRQSPCKLHFLCSPNNPTGDVIPAEAIIDLARQVADHGLLVVDEAYIEFASTSSLARRVEAQPNLVVLRTLSKAFALAGCRIGAVIADPDIIGLLRRIIAPYPLPTPAVGAAIEALSEQGQARMRRQLAILATEKQRLLAVLNRHAGILQVWPGEANFVLVRAADRPGLVAAAAHAGIRLRDQSSQPGLEHCVRITVGAPEDNHALIEFLEGWQP